jgi:hypothetical protein
LMSRHRILPSLWPLVAGHHPDEADLAALPIIEFVL